jgi:hypothetical protein
VIAQAQSGTGKTATFGISVLQRIDIANPHTQALIMAPTRELAQQVGHWRLLWQLASCVVYYPPFRTHSCDEMAVAGDAKLVRWRVLLELCFTVFNRKTY